MELLYGLDLADAIKLQRTYEPADVVPIIDQVLSGLEAAHQLGVVHRDLKPANVFLARSLDDELLVKIVDFGVVKICNEDARQQLTRTGVVVGTPHYMAPEQARGQEVDGRADLYAVGCILYQMLCGRPPFDDESLLLVLSKQFGEVPRPPSERRPGMKGAAAIDRFVGRALEKDPAQRFQSAAEMRRALAALAIELGAADAPKQKITLESLRLTPPHVPEGAVPDADLARTDPRAVPDRGPASVWPIVWAAVLGAVFAGSLVYLLLRGSPR
jgi:eukaryotic-like serine/threonine-protein kinase